MITDETDEYEELLHLDELQNTFEEVEVEVLLHEEQEVTDEHEGVVMVVLVETEVTE